MSLGLTPAGQLRWAPRDGDPVPPALARLPSAFDSDWRAALFALAADRIDAQGSPAVRYWQAIAERHLTALCQLPEREPRTEVEPPTPAECAAWILSAPPMHGGEYLSADSLQRIWTHLNEWVSETVPGAGGLPAFLRTRAPSWHQVGRVCFHLAENRNDEARPFAFMATYAAGFGAAGRVKHLPLRRALEQYAGARNRAALVTLLAPIQAGRRGVRLGARAGRLGRRLPAAGVAAGARLPAPAQRARARGERPVGAAAELVAQAAAPAGGRDDRRHHPVAGRRGSHGGLRRRRRPRRPAPVAQ